MGTADAPTGSFPPPANFPRRIARVIATRLAASAFQNGRIAERLAFLAAKDARASYGQPHT